MQIICILIDGFCLMFLGERNEKKEYDSKSKGRIGLEAREPIAGTKIKKEFTRSV